jgi:hypothetical protein
MLFKHSIITQDNVYFNSLKLGDNMLNIRKAIFIRDSENSVILFKQKKKQINKSKTKIFPIGRMHIY